MELIMDEDVEKVLITKERYEEMARAEARLKEIEE